MKPHFSGIMAKCIRNVEILVSSKNITLHCKVQSVFSVLEVSPIKISVIINLQFMYSFHIENDHLLCNKPFQCVVVE